MYLFRCLFLYYFPFTLSKIKYVHKYIKKMYLGAFNDIFTEALNSRGLNVLFLQFSGDKLDFIV